MFRNKYISVFMGVCLFLILFALGTGSALGATAISTPQGLQNMANDLAEDYYLTSDIDLSGQSWVSIGASENPFTGSLNGYNYTISNLTSYNGLFYIVNNSQLSNIVLTNATIYSSLGSAGVLATVIGWSDVRNCKILNSSVIGENSYIGGLVAVAMGSNIENCYIQSNLNGTNVVGGIVGYMERNGSILNCIFEGNITASYVGETVVGGIVAWVNVGGANIQNCLSLGNIFASNGGSGILALGNNGVTITHCVALQKSTTGITRICSDTSVNIVGCFAYQDMTHTGYLSPIFGPNTRNGANITIADFLGNKAFYQDGLGWKFDSNNWKINNMGDQLFADVDDIYLMPYLGDSVPSLTPASTFNYDISYTMSGSVIPITFAGINTSDYTISWQKALSGTTNWASMNIMGQTANLTSLNSGNYIFRMALTDKNTNVWSYSPHLPSVYIIQSYPAVELYTEKITLNTYASQIYNPYQQYAIPLGISDIKFINSNTAYLVSGSTPYVLNAKTGVVSPMSQYIGGGTMMQTAINTNGVLIESENNIISFYNASGNKYTYSTYLDELNFHIMTLGKQNNVDVAFFIYTYSTATAKVKAIDLTNGNTIYDAAGHYPYDYTGAVGNPNLGRFAVWSANTLQIVSNDIWNYSIDVNLDLTSANISSVQSIDNTNNFIVRTTEYVAIVNGLDGSIISISSNDVPVFSEVRADQNGEYIGINESTLNFVNATGGLSNYYKSIAKFNTLAFASESGIWAAAGGNDMRLTILGKTSPTLWNVSQQISFSNVVSKVAISTGGYFIVSVIDDSLYLLSQSTPITSDTVLTTKYYLQVYLYDGTNPMPNTQFMVGLDDGAPITYKTDSSGLCVIEVVPTRTYTISFADGSRSTKYIATNYALQQFILTKIPNVPFNSGLTFDVTSDDYKVITMTYNDSYARTNLVKFTIYDSNGNLMQTFEASSNNCTFTYDAYYTISDFASVEMLVSSASTTDTATKTWKIWLATYLDPANQTGIILPGANKPIIPAELLGINTGGVNTFSLSDSVANVLPVKVSADVLQIFACGIIMVICGLFSAQSSVKGTVIVSVIAALLYWMDFLHTNLWGTLAFAFVLAIFNVFAYASQTEGN